MKQKPKRLRRQVFVLTPEEKKAVACILATFLLGLGTKQYRAAHPRSAPPPTARQQYVTQRTAKAAAARTRSARGQSAATAPAPVVATPEPEPLEDD